jgi:hypothetical protein
MWDVLVPKAGEYCVELSYARPDPSSDVKVEVSLDEKGRRNGRKLAGTAGGSSTRTRRWARSRCRRARTIARRRSRRRCRHE